MVNALSKLIDAAVEADRDPSYVHPSDTDPTAATIAADTDSIKTSVGDVHEPRELFWRRVKRRDWRRGVPTALERSR